MKRNHAIITAAIAVVMLTSAGVAGIASATPGKGHGYGHCKHEPNPNGVENGQGHHAYDREDCDHVNTIPTMDTTTTTKPHHSDHPSTTTTAPTTTTTGPAELIPPATLDRSSYNDAGVYVTPVEVTPGFTG